MIEYVLLNPDGTVFQRGRCELAVDIPDVPGTTSEVVTAADQRRPKTRAAPGYKEYRAMAYPAVGDQLDALWKAIDTAGIATGDTAAMLAKVKAVKAQFPKE